MVVDPRKASVLSLDRGGERRRVDSDEREAARSARLENYVIGNLGEATLRGRKQPHRLMLSVSRPRWSIGRAISAYWLHDGGTGTLSDDRPPAAAAAMMAD